MSVFPFLCYAGEAQANKTYKLMFKMLKIARFLFRLVLAVSVFASAAQACNLGDIKIAERPNNNGRPTEVTASLIVADILGVDVVNQQIEIDLIVRLSWIENEGCAFAPNRIWFPQITFFNSSRLRQWGTYGTDQVAYVNV